MHDIDCFNWMFEYFSILSYIFKLIIIYILFTHISSTLIIQSLFYLQGGVCVDYM